MHPQRATGGGEGVHHRDESQSLAKQNEQDEQETGVNVRKITSLKDQKEQAKRTTCEANCKGKEHTQHNIMPPEHSTQHTRQ